MNRLVSRIFLAVLMYGYACTFPARAAEFDQGIWDGLLKKHVLVVRGGEATQVDYAGMMQDRIALNRYLSSTSRITRADFDQWDKKTQLSFLINAYNAWTIELVLSAYPGIRSIKDIGSFLQSPWKKSYIPLLGETRSLDNIEHDLIRGSARYNDPRIHFAINCASIGCPALRAEAYAPDRLDAQLEDATNKFLSDRSRNRFNGESIMVSSIFKWYRDDFEKGWRGTSTLAQFLGLYSQSLMLDAKAVRRLLAGDMPIKFLDYDWRLNDKGASLEKGRQ